MKTQLIILALIVLSLTSCKKDKDNKPVARKDVFECKVNGQLWKPEASFPDNALTSSYQSGVFSLNAKKIKGLPNPMHEEIYHSGYFLVPGEYQFNGIPHTDPVYIDFRKVVNGAAHFYITDSIYNGKMIITKLDTVAGIIAGTFYFDAIDTTTNDIVHITEGKFDVKY